MPTASALDWHRAFAKREDVVVHAFRQGPLFQVPAFLLQVGHARVCTGTRISRSTTVNVYRADRNYDFAGFITAYQAGRDTPDHVLRLCNSLNV